MGVGNFSGFDPNAFGPFGALFQNYFSVLENMSQGRSAFGGGFGPQAELTAPFKATARCQLEFMGLANRRLQAYMQVPARLAQCRTPQDLVNEQMAFWRTATDQYRESMIKAGEAWGQALPWLSSGATKADRDYINFNGTGSKDGGAHGSRQEPGSGKQRRVA